MSPQQAGALRHERPALPQHLLGALGAQSEGRVALQCNNGRRQTVSALNRAGCVPWCVLCAGRSGMCDS